ncbi:MAG: hypothetical protein ACLSWI_02040 [Candidatus Gastranaerophilaceae bacterium]
MNSNYLEIKNEENNLNFNTALNLYENNFSHQDLINFLKNGSVVEKQISALKLEKITSTSDAETLVSNLTGQDGKIREAVSFKLKEFSHNQEFINYFHNQFTYDTLLDAVIDINGNICRNVIFVICNLKNNIEFCNYFCPKLSKLTMNLLEKIKEFNIQDGKYKVNKEVFKLYWCLETIYHLYDKFDIQSLKCILYSTKNIEDYTIREKTAKILTKNFNDELLTKIRIELKNDKNYYVRRF